MVKLGNQPIKNGGWSSSGYICSGQIIATWAPKLLLRKGNPRLFQGIPGWWKNYNLSRSVWLIFLRNHLLYIKIQRKSLTIPQKLTNKPVVIYPPNFYTLKQKHLIENIPKHFFELELEPLFLFSLPSSVFTPQTRRFPSRGFPRRLSHRASSKPHLHDLQDARTQVEHRLAGTLRGDTTRGGNPVVSSLGFSGTHT